MRTRLNAVFQISFFELESFSFTDQLGAWEIAVGVVAPLTIVITFGGKWSNYHCSPPCSWWPSHGACNCFRLADRKYLFTRSLLALCGGGYYFYNLNLFIHRTQFSYLKLASKYCIYDYTIADSLGLLGLWNNHCRTVQISVYGSEFVRTCVGDVVSYNYTCTKATIFFCCCSAFRHEAASDWGFHSTLGFHS